MCTKKEADGRTQQQRGGTFWDRAQQYADVKNPPTQPGQGGRDIHPETRRFLETGRAAGQDLSRPARL